MQISEIKDGDKAVEVVAMVTDVSLPRSVTLRTGEVTEVADATLMDEKGGSIKLSLWREDVKRVSKGMKVKVTNGYVNKFRDELFLNTGRYGKLEPL